MYVVPARRAERSRTTKTRGVHAKRSTYHHVGCVSFGHAAFFSLSCLPGSPTSLASPPRSPLLLPSRPGPDLLFPPTPRRLPTACAMQPGPTSPDETPAPEMPEEDAAQPDDAAAAEDAEPAEEEEEQEEEERKERRSARGRKRRRRGGAPGSSAPAAAAPLLAPAGPRGLVMVKRDLLARCMTCPLCRRLLRDATTISECLHTFCRKCIYQKFNDEEVECCPIPSNAEASNHSSNKDTEGDSKDSADKAELWQPLNCLVEAANRTKSFRSNSQNPVVKGEQFNGSPSSTYASKTKARENLQKSKIEDDKKDVPMPPVLPKRRAQGSVRRRREVQPPADAKPAAAAAQKEKKFSSIWFSLVASFDQQGDPPLPQIPSHYLRIKDGDVPASSIQKYLMQKLSLPSESEVEIKCCEQPVNPMQPLRNLVELWLKGRATQTTQTMTGSSAKEFVMVLTYGRPKASAL
nr:unnamed protein product [Digitaria exilis]